MMDQLRLYQLLEECTGHDIWSVEHCRRRGVPESWIEELAEAFESSFFDDRDTIYVAAGPTNQYFGIHDLQLAKRIAKLLGIDVGRYEALTAERGALVRALQDAVEDGE